MAVVSEQFARSVRRFVRRSGFDIAKATPRLIDFLQDRKIGRVIDVGANTGQYGRMLRGHLYRGRITSLEPIASVFALLAESTRGDPLWDAINVGAGDHDGDATINVSEDTRFSSIHRIKPEMVETGDPASRSIASETIALAKLDTLFPDLDDRTFLKIDTQGHERAVLDGAQNLLARVTAVQMELPCLHLYDGVWTFGEAVTRMEQMGFRVCQMSPVTFAPHDRASMVDVDVIFGR